MSLILTAVPRTRALLFRRMLLLSFCFPFTGALSQAPAITATVDIAKTGAVEVSGNSPQPKPAFPAGGDQPAVNPGSPTYPLDVSAALSDDRKTLTIAVLNPSDAEQSIHLGIHGAAVASTGKLWRMAPNSIDAGVKAGSPAEVQVEEQSLDALPATVTLRPYSVNIYSYSLQ
jgi:alpha-N-arabinofuranosidase